MALRARREPVDFLTLLSELEHRHQLQEVGGAAYLSSLINATPTAVHALAYARQVKDTAIRRRIIWYASEAVRLAWIRPDSWKRCWRREAGAFKLREGLRATTLRPLAEAVAEVQANLQAVIAGQTPELLTTGFSDLDKLIGGWRCGSLNIVVAGQPRANRRSCWVLWPMPPGRNRPC